VSARLKIDEDLPRQMRNLIAERGYEAATVTEQGWQGASDEVLWSRVQAEGRWLITGDRGFADLRQYPPGSHAGVILLRAQEESRRAYLELAAVALDRLRLEEIAGSIVVVTRRGVRVRRPLAR